jgi:hypothetical protein
MAVEQTAQDVQYDYGPLRNSLFHRCKCLSYQYLWQARGLLMDMGPRARPWAAARLIVMSLYAFTSAGGGARMA